MTWIIIIGTLVLVFAWILLAPIYLIISTSESKCEAGLPGILKVRLTIDDEGLPELTGKFLFFRIKIPMFKFRAKKRKKRTKKLTRQQIHFVLKITWRIFRTLKLKQLKLNIDTGDVINNAYLIPVFSMIYKDKIQFSVNYEQQNEFILHLEHNLGIMAMHTISTFIKHKLKK